MVRENEVWERDGRREEREREDLGRELPNDWYCTCVSRQDYILQSKRNLHRISVTTSTLDITCEVADDKRQ